MLLSADYSQVELRILAHFSRDEELLAAFRSGEDVHRRTAAGVLGVAPEEVSADQRARAKANNFGIIYGSSAFGIANQLGIASAEAQKTIDAYFARYRAVRRFLDETIETARTQGYVHTLLGRRRYLPDLGSRNRVLRNAQVAIDGDPAKVVCEIEFGKGCPVFQFRAAGTIRQCVNNQNDLMSCDHFGSTEYRDDPQTPAFEGQPAECAAQKGPYGYEAGFIAIVHGKGEARSCVDKTFAACGPFLPVDH